MNEPLELELAAYYAAIFNSGAGALPFGPERVIAHDEGMQYLRKHFPTGKTLKLLERINPSVEGLGSMDIIAFPRSSGTLAQYNWMHLQVKWWLSGRQTVRLSDKLQAALLVTDLPNKDDVTIPYPALVVEPEGLVTYDESLNKQARATHIIASTAKGLEGANGETSPGGYAMVIRVVGREGKARLHTLTGHKYSDLEEFASARDSSGEEYLSRLYRMASRLFGHVCLYLTNDGAFKKSSQRVAGTGRKKKAKNAVPLPVYTLTQDVEHDFREHIRTYCRGVGAGAKLTKRTLVRGYWYAQPHGPRNSLRRRQFRQPTWRNPKGAGGSDTVLRKHLLKNSRLG